MYTTYYRDGLGFPIVPIIMGASSLVGLFKGKKGKPKVTEADAKKAVQQIYLELLERDPWNPHDAGAMGYVQCLVEGWCDTDFVRTEVLKSKEYHDVQQRKAAAAYGAAPGATPSSSSAGVLSPSFGSAFGGLNLGPYAPYLIGGVVLLMLLRRR